MNERAKENTAVPAGIGLDDIYFVLFRRKWLILAFALAGVLAAGALYFILPNKYVAEARLLLRYVVEARSTAPTDKDKGPEVKSPDARGETLINSELEILTSGDLARDVAASLDTNLLAKVAGKFKPRTADREADQRNAAAGAIADPKSLLAEVPKGSSIIKIHFEHTDPEVVRPVLESLVTNYVKKHLEIHRGMGVMNTALIEPIQAIKTAILANDQVLRPLMLSNNIISLEESRKSYQEELTRLQGAKLAAEAELAERKATYNELQPSKTEGKTNEIGAPVETIEEYKSVLERWYAARKREAAVSEKYNDESPAVVAARAQVAAAQKKKKELEDKFPKLVTLNVPPPASGSSAGEKGGQVLDPATEYARLKAQEARVIVLSNQFAQVLVDANRLETLAPEITKRLRLKEELDAKLRYYQSVQEQASGESEGGAGHITNIAIVQSATSVGTAASKKNKVVLGSLFGLVAAGLALAFGLELFLDPRIKRASEIVSKLHVPLFMSIPGVYRNGSHKPLPSKVAVEPVVAPDPATDPLKPYHDAVRDRLTMYFQARNMTHKPKLVGVTGHGRGSGVSTLASGLAASLSELGCGNVLLVDMGVPNGAAHSFHNGQPARTLLEALQPAPAASAAEGSQLVLAKGNDTERSGATLVPSRFSALMPKLKASDYDYIVFDMPPVTSTSPTASLASMLDMTFFVIECEKSNREAVKQSISLLAAAQANVAAVLNKSRNYLPAWLHEEI